MLFETIAAIRGEICSNDGKKRRGAKVCAIAVYGDARARERRTNSGVSLAP